MANTKAIVTLVVGDKYMRQWKNRCQSNWQEYADRHGYDLVYFEHSLDDSERSRNRSISWQRCLVPQQEVIQKYEQIVWVDSDILINPATAPCIVKDVPVDKVGATDVWTSPTLELYRDTLSRKYEYYKYSGITKVVINPTAREFYKNWGLSPDFDHIVQAGVMVFSPHHHREILEKIYYIYDDKGGPEWNYEMRPLSWELLKADCVHWIDHRFNLIWFDYLCLHYPFLLNKSNFEIVRKVQRKLTKTFPEIRSKQARVCANTAYINSYFLHFAGCATDMALVDTKIRYWQDLAR
jgi:hypothetical protein